MTTHIYFDPARTVGFVPGGAYGYKRLAKGSFRSFCQGGVGQARFVGYRAGRKVYGLADKCREFNDPYSPYGPYLPDDPYHRPRVEKPCNPPWGIYRQILLRLSLTGTACFGNTCPAVVLTYDENDRKWKGGLRLEGGGSIAVEYECQAPSGVGIKRIGTLTFKGNCIGSDAYSPGSISFPINAGCDGTTGTGLPYLGGESFPFNIKASCCGQNPNDTSPVQIAATLTLSDLSRPVWPARLVGFRGGKKLFAKPDDCPKLNRCPNTDTCCGCEASPNTWAMTVAGVTNATPVTCTECPSFNGDWQLVYRGGCRWSAVHPGVCTPGTPWSLSCNAGDGLWTLTTSAAPVAAVYTLAVSAWRCFGPNVMTLTTPDTVRCSSFPPTLTLTAA